MWKLRVVLVAAGLLAGCGAVAGSSEEAGDDGRPVVLTTFTVIADMARVVGGDAVVVESLLDPGVEVHGYEPTPRDLTRAARADLVLDNGLGLERWFEDFMERIDAPHAVVSDGIDPIPIGPGDGDAANPHAWMSPVEAAVYVENIRAALTDLSPADADAFAANAAAFRAEIDDLHGDLTTAVASLPPEHRALVTCEGAFSYLARDAGLTEAYLWPVNSDVQGTPQRIADTIGFVRDRDVPTVFCESTVSDEAQRQVAGETGADLGEVLYVDSLSEPDGPVPTYLDLLRHDIDAIVAGLSVGRHAS